MRPEVNGSDTDHVVCQGYSLNIYSMWYIYDVNIQVQRTRDKLGGRSGKKIASALCILFLIARRMRVCYL